MYKLMMIFSYLIRQFCLPNPFDSMGHQITIPLGMFELPIPSILMNMLVEPVLYAFTFAIVGIYYVKRSMPALGSLLYLVFYIIHVGLLTLMARFDFTVIAVVVIMSGYAICHIAFLLLRNQMNFLTLSRR